MNLISNHLLHRVEAGVMMKLKYSWLIVPLATFVYTAFHYLAVLSFPQVGGSLVAPFLFFILTCIFFGGPVSSLVGAGIFSAYAYIEADFDGWRLVQTVIFSVAGAIMSVVVRQLLIKWRDEAEYYRQKAIDTYNGNRAKMVEALDNLDKALEARDIVEVKRLVQVARIKQADTLTLVDSWHEMAKDKRLAIEAIEESAGYPWRADEKIKNIDIVVHEILKEIYRIRRMVEADKTAEEQ